MNEKNVYITKITIYIEGFEIKLFNIFLDILKF